MAQNIFLEGSDLAAPAYLNMPTQLLALVVLVGLTAAALLVCLAKWGVLQAWEVRRPSWFMRRCDFCLGYWLSVVFLLVAGSWQLRTLGLPWYWLAVAVPAGLPAAAVCRAVVGPL